MTPFPSLGDTVRDDSALLACNLFWQRNSLVPGTKELAVAQAILCGTIGACTSTCSLHRINESHDLLVDAMYLGLNLR